MQTSRIIEIMLQPGSRILKPWSSVNTIIKKSRDNFFCDARAEMCRSTAGGWSKLNRQLQTCTYSKIDCIAMFSGHAGWMVCWWPGHWPPIVATCWPARERYPRRGVTRVAWRDQRVCESCDHSDVVWLEARWFCPCWLINWLGNPKLFGPLGFSILLKLIIYYNMMLDSFESDSIPIQWKVFKISNHNHF